MQELSTLLSVNYSVHIKELQSRANNALLKSGSADFIAIHAGIPNMVFLDDYPYPFKVNPHFKAWLPILDSPNCWLVVNGVDKPKLFYFQPVDFWHKVIPLAEHYWNEYFDIEIINTKSELNKALKPYMSKSICISEHTELVAEMGFTQINQSSLVDYLHYHRAYKTNYELECLRRSNAISVKGHQAAKAAFYDGLSEFDIYMAYLNVSKQTESATPYGSIVALNENAAILHYMHFERRSPKETRSFLIDAGATFHGYASDITRTYSFEKNCFSELIDRMHSLMQESIKGLKIGESYVDLHQSTYQNIAKVLSDFDILKVSPEEACEKEIVTTFFPHGLGHHLGMQTHDVAGFMQDEEGTHLDVPKKFSTLRVSRRIEARQVFTIEPGIYFIDSLLADLKSSSSGNLVNWDVINELKPFGGVRI
ncbi:MAG: Xaa-Pro dipeptidase, partial [Kangiellaceae bacterium]|nr:Xaa-Pro dipeptidase [Kangiellaceae bacterium]